MRRSNYKGVVIAVTVMVYAGLIAGCSGTSDVTMAPAQESTETESVEYDEVQNSEMGSTMSNVGDEGSASIADEHDNDQSEEAEDAEEAEVTPEPTAEPTPEPTAEPTPIPKKPVDLIFFMGQSNMSGCGGNAALAPVVNEDAGYEFRAISDPTTLYPITEPFGINENYIGAILEVPGEKKGSLVSAFVNEYYEETGVSVVAISASKGATTTRDWISQPYADDVINRYRRAIEYLNNNNYEIRKRYIVWLQGESDADKGIGKEEYATNLDTIIRPFFQEGLDKVFIITPGRTLSRRDFFRDIIDVQIEMCQKSDYYSLATNVLSGISTECMSDEWHYNQNALNKVGVEAAKSLAYYSNTGKEMCIYDYLHDCTYIPQGYDYPEDTVVEKEDLSTIDTTR